MDWWKSRSWVVKVVCGLVMLCACGGGSQENSGDMSDVAAVDQVEEEGVSADQATAGEVREPDLLEDLEAEQDSGGGVPDSGSDGPGETEDSQEVGPVPEGVSEAVDFTTSHSCIGCQGVQICDGLPLSDGYAVTLQAAPHAGEQMLFAAERWEAPGRELALGTCELVQGDELKQIAIPPQGVEVLDGGSITLTGAMPLLEEPLEVSYHELTHNYDAVARLAPEGASWEDHYLPGEDLQIEAPGGVDLGGFDAASAAPGSFELLSPATDDEGQIASVDVEKELLVKWSGGEGFDTVVLYLQGSWCPAGVANINFMLYCNVPNNGEFTIPQDMMKSLEWPNYVELFLSMSKKVPLEIDGLDNGPAWSVRAIASTYIYEDLTVSPELPECESTSIEEGLTGEDCLSDDDCGSGCCLPEVDAMYFLGNYCSVTGCQSDGDCPADAACAPEVHPSVPWDSYCAKLCEKDSDCRFPEYYCGWVGGETNACVPNAW